jgi:transposase
MRQLHVAGERMFVDYAGTTLEVMDGTTGEARVCQLFVAALGASNYTYAEATLRSALSTGSARMCGPSRFSTGSRRRSSPTI